MWVPRVGVYKLLEVLPGVGATTVLGVFHEMGRTLRRFNVLRGPGVIFALVAVTM